MNSAYAAHPRTRTRVYGCPQHLFVARQSMLAPFHSRSKALATEPTAFEPPQSNPGQKTEWNEASEEGNRNRMLERSNAQQTTHVASPPHFGRSQKPGFTYQLTDRSVSESIHLRSFVESFNLSFTHSFIHSFIHPLPAAPTSLNYYHLFYPIFLWIR